MVREDRTATLPHYLGTTLGAPRWAICNARQAQHGHSSSAPSMTALVVVLLASASSPRWYRAIAEPTVSFVRGENGAEPGRSSRGVLNNRVRSFIGQRKLDEAEAYLREAIRANRRAHGPLHKDTLNAENSLAVVLFRRGKCRESERLQRKVLAGMTATLGRTHDDTQQARANLAVALRQRGRAAEAQAFVDQHSPSRDGPAAIAALVVVAACLY